MATSVIQPIKNKAVKTICLPGVKWKRQKTLTTKWESAKFTKNFQHQFYFCAIWYFCIGIISFLCLWPLTNNDNNYDSEKTGFKTVDKNCPEILLHKKLF